MGLRRDSQGDTSESPGFSRGEEVKTAFRPNLYVLKGGANLRYFFGSFRYSQDIDLDYLGGESWRLEEAVDRVLAGPALGMSLRTSGISIIDPVKPKQTETTMRWKMGLASARSGSNTPVRTKIEFSARGADPSYDFVTIPDEVLERSGLRSFSVQRYRLSAMIEQKIHALATRSGTKARDVFDLDLLFRLRAKSGNEEAVASEYVEEAYVCALSLPDESFRSEVVPFLEPEVAGLYAAPDTWGHMRTFVSTKWRISRHLMPARKVRTLIWTGRNQSDITDTRDSSCERG